MIHIKKELQEVKKELQEVKKELQEVKKELQEAPDKAIETIDEEQYNPSSRRFFSVQIGDSYGYIPATRRRV